MLIMLSKFLKNMTYKSYSSELLLMVYRADLIYMLTTIIILLINFLSLFPWVKYPNGITGWKGIKIIEASDAFCQIFFQKRFP